MLLMGPDRKKHVATIIVGGSKPDFVQKIGDKSEQPEIDMPKYCDDMGDADAAVMAAMQKFVEAMEANDTQAMAQCFKDAVVACVEAEKGYGKEEE